MPTPEKKQKKLLFNEEDIATLTQRYDARTVLTLLQEVANYPHPKIDWNELVKRTSTRISNAREYQLLWRHLAYRHALPENPEDVAEPLDDDDSDLECDLEALPPISADSASEAAACVKVIIDSRMLSESTPSSSMIEAPLPVNVPVCHSSSIPDESSEPSNLMQRKSIIFPVTVQRQPLQTVSSTEGIETKGVVGGSMASKRKRNAWSEKEDMQLRAAVERWGEGNWAAIAKGDSFRVERSPLQLAQRWGSLRKKSGSTIQATNNAISCAIDPPSNRPLKKPTPTGATNPARTPSNLSIKGPVQQPCNVAEASTIRSNFATAAKNPSQKVLLDTCGYPEKPKSIPETRVAKYNPTTESTIKANTIVTGARILSPSDTVSQLKVAQARKDVSSLAKPTVPVVGLCSNPKVHSDVSGARTGTSIAPAPVASHPAPAVTSSVSCISTMKSPPVNKVQPKQEVIAGTGTSIAPAPVTSHPAATVTSLVPCTSTVKSPPVNKVQQKQEVIATEEFKVSDTRLTPKDMVQAHDTPASTTNHHMPDLKKEEDKI